MVAPKIPAPIRVIKSHVNGERPSKRPPGESDEARPKIAYETIEPARPMIKIGRRPTRSDTRPQIGEKMNCMAENEAISMPSVLGPASKCCAYRGNSGRTMAKPKRSIKTVTKMIARLDRLCPSAELASAMNKPIRKKTQERKDDEDQGQRRHG